MVFLRKREENKVEHPPPGAAAAAVDARPTCSTQNQADGEPTFLALALAEPRRLNISTYYFKSMGCCGSSTVDAEEHLDYSAGNVTVVTDQKRWENTMEEVAEHGKTVVLKFSAIWCTPCRNAAPLFAELSLKYPDIVFVSVDVDEMPELVTQFDVRATPTFIFMKNNEEIDKLVGGNHEDLQDKFEQLNRPKLYDDV
uniref:Thioredoxin domain-containing protein n=1 Tax=Oryza punctata TaxID=4537 RepID=A0A0E0L3V5_ORYPU